MTTALKAEGKRQKAEVNTFDVHKVRADFPILSELIHGKPLVYLDSANTSQKPLSVIKATDDYYRHANANIHRATHLLSERATALYEGARGKAAKFLNAGDAHTIVLTKGTTDGINLVAQSYGRPLLKPGDEIVLSWLEHHSNIVPWQLVAEQTGATIRVVSINAAGELDLEEYARCCRAHQDRRRRPRLERARHDQSDQVDDRPGARRRRRRARRRRAGRAAPRDRRAGPRL
jgi:selenocysteine lyase/cysteine desulfurase